MNLALRSLLPRFLMVLNGYRPEYIGRLMLATQDVTWILFFLVYGIDGSMTIFHRILLHENLGQAHRKHAYQLMANELKMSHVAVSLIYMVLQLAVSLGFIYLCPATVLAHWIYLLAASLRDE